MRALTLVDKKKFELIEKNIPEATGKKVVIRVKKTGICGSDIHMIWQTGYGAGTNFVIGHEFAGVISDPGNSTTFKVGDRVTAMEIDSCLDCEFCNSGREHICDQALVGGPGIGTDGGYGEYVAVREDMVRLLPDNVSFVEGAMVEPAAVSMHGVRLAHINKNSKVLITGCGPIGMFAAVCAYAEGAREIYITEANKERVKMANQSGYVTKAINALDENLETILNEAAPHGFDAVIECSGNKIAAETGIKHLKKGGHMVLVAFGEAPDLDLFTVVSNELHISGSVFFTRKEFEDVIRLMGERKINLTQFAKIIEMEDVQKSLEAMEEGQESAIKLVINME